MHLLQKYKEYEKDVAIEEIDGLQLVKKLAKNMEDVSQEVWSSAGKYLWFLLHVPKDTKATVIDEPNSEIKLAHLCIHNFLSLVHEDKQVLKAPQCPFLG